MAKKLLPEGLKLPAKFKREWVKRLRSGKYKQGKNRLCLLNDDEAGQRFCCLGVGADILDPKGWSELHDSLDVYKSRCWREPNSNVIITPTLNEMDKIEDKIKLALQQEINALDDNVESYLASRNDGNWSFKKIATWIEKNL